MLRTSSGGVKQYINPLPVGSRIPCTTIIYNTVVINHHWLVRMWLKIRLPKWIKLRAMLESSRGQGVTHKEWPTSRIGIHEAMFFFTAEVPHTDAMFRDMRLPASLGEAPIWVRVLVWFTAASAWWIQNSRGARWLDRGGWGRNLFLCSLKDSLEKKGIIDNHRPSKERLWTYLDSRQRSKICVFVLRFLKEWGYNMDTTVHTGILPNIWEDLTCQYESFVLSAAVWARWG